MAIISNAAHLPHPATFEQETLRFLSEFKYTGVIPSLDHIAAISHYFSRLPYENISKIIKREQQQDSTLLRLPDEVTDDHFAWHSGGTCFSLTYFLTGIYSILGYETHPLICQLNWGENNHSAVKIHFNNAQYLVDPGYMIFKPMPLVREVARTRLSAETGVELNFDSEAEIYSIYTFRKGNRIRRYQFLSESVPYEKFSEYWRASFDLPGMDDLTLTRVQGSEMLFIQGDFIKITRPDHIEKMREIDLAEKLIKDRFAIPLEKLEEARFLLAQRHKQDES